MAEVGRVAVCDPGALLPGGFWAAVSVWLERPQVANKRLWGVRLEGRRSVVLLRTEARGPGSGTGPEEERAAVGCGPDSGPGPSRHPLGGGPGPRPSADVAGSPGQPGLADVGEDDRPTSDLDSLWAEFSGSLAGDNRDLLAFLTGSGAEPRPGAQQGLDVVLRTVIPKTSPHRPLPAPKRELVLRDVAGGAVTFLPLEEDAEGGVKVRSGSAYRIQLGRVGGQWLAFPVIAPLGSCHSHSCEPWSHFGDQRWHSDGIVYPTLTWLREELLAKLARWSVEGRQSGFKRTLSLVSIDKYSRAYQELKKKYKDLVKVWPEVTNPEKFVYEDVAIAAYLLVLWAEERAERGVAAKQSFVDLGCGNGLLVHVLSSEGHPGRGIDVRRRKIWDMYGPQTCLEEDAITPNDRTLFPDVDWVIGNHSDELTPWIPVIAARSSYNCRFFVLPCCFFDFVGRYHRTQSQKTQYRGYLDFITEVGLTCGFHVEEDCLRIPSTKRVCLIGKYRTYPPAAEASVDAQRTQYIQRRGRCPESPPGRAPAPTAPEAAASGADRPAGHHDRHGTLDAGTEGLWLSRFRPREKAERVRNCAALPRDFVDHVVLQVASLLLGGKQLNPQSSHGTSLKTWNRGESLSLAEVAGKLDRETLQRLKRECGGLQTLLKNSHQVFEVLNGRVHIRDWRAEKLQEGKPPEARRSLLPGAFKTRLCWFFAHHPDGCVLPADRCPFAHGPGELRPPPATKRRKQSL